MRTSRFYGAVYPYEFDPALAWLVCFYQPATTSEYPQEWAVTCLLNKDLQVNLEPKFRKI
jgi:hypothetical protein